MASSNEISKLGYIVDFDNKDLIKGLSESDKLMVKTGENITKTGDKISTGMKLAGAGIVAAGAGLTLYAKNATDFTVQLVKDSKALGREIGVSTEEASRLTAALGRMGIEAGEASQMFGIFSKKIVESTKSTTDSKLAYEKLTIEIEQTKAKIKDTNAEIAAHGDKSGALGLKVKELTNTLASQQAQLTSSSDAFQRLGISTVDADGKQKDFNTILFEVADKFKTMPDGIDKTATSMELFGRQGKDMIKVLNLGADGIRDLEEKADELGLTLNGDTIAKVNELVQSQKDLKGQTDALKIAVGTATAPVLTKFNEGLNKMLGKLLESEGPMKTITTLILAFGGGALSAITSITTLGASLVGMGMSLATLGWIALAIIAIAAAAYLVYTNWETIKQWFTSFMQWLQDNWQLVLGILFAPFGLAIYLITTHWETIKNFILGLIQWFRDNWQLILAILTGPFGLAVYAIIRNWETIKAFFLGIVNWFRDIGNKIGDGISNGVSSAIEKVKGVVKGAVNWIIDKVNWAIRGVNKTAGKVPGVPTLSEVPKLRTGIENFGGGLAYVHKGEMLANLAPGTSVIKKSDVEAMVGGAQGGGGVNINIGKVDSLQTADYILRQINRNYKLESMGLSPVNP